MAHIPGFSFDIFISYAHLDNQGLTSGAGWIEKFYKRLDVLLRQLMGTNDIGIWWDDQKLDGTKLFDQSIQDGINGSAILLCLTSLGYLNSPYCLRELDLFYRKAQGEPAGLKVNDRSRIVHVLLQSIPHTDPAWPAQFMSTTGFPFHMPVKKPEDLGFPLSPSTKGFITQLQELGEALRRLIISFPKTAGSPALSQLVDLPSDTKEFKVFLGDVHDDLQPVKRRVAQELENNGIRVMPNLPPPYDIGNHDSDAILRLKEANLSIHLLLQRPGREIEGSANAWYPARQAELALEHSRSKIIWVPADMQTASVEEPGYRALLTDLEEGKSGRTNIDFIRGEKSTLIQTMVTAVHQLELSQAAAPQKKLAVLLDTHFNDQLYALELSKQLVALDVRSFINPHEDEPAKNIDLLSDRISMVSKLVFFYGKVSADWVVERMNAVLKLIVNNNYAVDEFFVLLLPPHKERSEIELRQKWLKVNIMPYDGPPGKVTGDLQRFLHDLNDGPI